MITNNDENQIEIDGDSGWVCLRQTMSLRRCLLGIYLEKKLL